MKNAIFQAFACGLITTLLSTGFAQNSPPDDNEDFLKIASTTLIGPLAHIGSNTNYTWSDLQGTPFTTLYSNEVKKYPWSARPVRNVKENNFLGIHLNKDFLKTGNSAEPATLSYADARGSTEQINIEGALGLAWPQVERGNIQANIYSGIEYNRATSDTSPINNYTIYPLLTRLERAGGFNPFSTNDYFVAGPTYSQDRVTGMNSWDFIFEWAPWGVKDERDGDKVKDKNLSKGASAQTRSAQLLSLKRDDEQRIDFLLRPRVALERVLSIDGEPKAKTIGALTPNGLDDEDGGAALDFIKDQNDTFARLSLELKAAVGKRITLGYEHNLRWDLDDGGKPLDLQRAYLNYAVGDPKTTGRHWSVEASWKEGHDFPSLEEIRKFEAGIGVRF